MKSTIASLFLLVLLVEGSPSPQILHGQKSKDVARVETGAIGRLVYGIVSIICLCALSFALGTFPQPTLHDTSDPGQAFV